MDSPYADLGRPPLRERALRRAVCGPGSMWSDVRVVEVTASTNADAAVAARAGSPAGLVVVAEEQTAGRGRLDRSWLSPARAGLTFSLLLRPPPSARVHLSWLPLVTGLALAEAVTAVAGVETALKWPNDVLVDGAKLAGILVEVIDDAAVVGIGLNVTSREDELPPGATSLLLLAALTTDRDTVLRAALRALETAYRVWAETGPSTLRERYLARSVTVGSRVRVLRAGGGWLEGVAEEVDGDGRLVVVDRDGIRQVVSSGDVEHVRDG